MRQSLALSALHLPTPHSQPLSDTAVTALFGKGEDARRTLINAWLDEGCAVMERDVGDMKEKNINALLKTRLRWNVPVLQHLPEVSAELLHSSICSKL